MYTVTPIDIYLEARVMYIHCNTYRYITGRVTMSYECMYTVTPIGIYHGEGYNEL